MLRGCVDRVCSWGVLECTVGCRYPSPCLYVHLADSAASPCSDNGTLQSSHTEVIVSRSEHSLMPMLDERGYCKGGPFVPLVMGVGVGEL